MKTVEAILAGYNARFDRRQEHFEVEGAQHVHFKGTNVSYRWQFSVLAQTPTLELEQPEPVVLLGLQFEIGVQSASVSSLKKLFCTQLSAVNPRKADDSV